MDVEKNKRRLQQERERNRAFLQAVLTSNTADEDAPTYPTIAQHEAQVLILAFFRCLTELRKLVGPSAPIEALLEPEEIALFAKQREQFTNLIYRGDFIGAKEELAAMVEQYPMEQDSILYMIAVRESGMIQYSDLIAPQV